MRRFAFRKMMYDLLLPVVKLITKITNITMTEKELKKIKDISCEFYRWANNNTFESGGKIYLSETVGTMSIEELFDYYVHGVLTEILIDKTKSSNN